MQKMRKMTIDDLMEKVAIEKRKVKIICTDGEAFVGMAMDYTKADDEEDGIPTVCVLTGEKSGICLCETEISSIEIIE